MNIYVSAAVSYTFAKNSNDRLEYKRTSKTSIFRPKKSHLNCPLCQSLRDMGEQGLCPMLCNFRGRVLPYGVNMLTLNTRLDTRRDSRVRLGSGNNAKTVQLRIVTDRPTDRPTRQREVLLGAPGSGKSVSQSVLVQTDKLTVRRWKNEGHQS